jgi:hypothetical protein
MSLEDALSMCCERGWAGFKAEWVREQRKGTLEERNRAVADEFLRKLKDQERTIDG